MFSIIIPTWNNLDFVKMCVASIRKNSQYAHQIILHINNGSDGTLQWAKDAGILFTYSEQNIGVCKSVNLAAGLSSGDYIVYMNDDMYVCPGWDTALVDEIRSLNTDCFMLSGTMVEPRNTHNACVIVADFGDDVSNFDEEGLLMYFNSFEKADWTGATWPPAIVHKKYWEITGGYSIEFSPGMSSDDDFSRKMWEAGCRIFKGVAASRIYHFQTKTTQRIVKNDGRKQFLMKWGIRQSTFNKYYIKRGMPYQGILPEPSGIPGGEKIKTWWKKKSL